MNKMFKGLAAFSMGAMVLTGCGANDAEGTTDDAIHVVSREEGSGTRGAFIELFGIEEKDENEEKVDHTIDTAEITNSTSVMLSTVEGNTSAIGYVSLGSLNDKIEAAKIDGVEATSENVKSGEYKVSRPFVVCTKGEELSEIQQDFMDYILSEQGQAVVEEKGFIAQETTTTYTSKNLSGDLTVGGSSSIAPLMEKLAEEYQKENPDVNVAVQQSDSTTGATSTIEGVYDIGMCSRELKPEEIDQGLVPTVIATDGIAVIVNKESSVKDLTTEQVKDIYTGKITSWSEIAE